MANKIINGTVNGLTGYAAAVSIDGANDYLLIQQAAGVYKSINRQTLLGVTGTPMDISTVQSVTNKTLDNTNQATLKSNKFTLQDLTDTTKQAVFSIAGVTTGTTRTYTLPNATVTLASLSGVEVLTNKTITSPAITGGTIDNSAITVDSISGHTTSTLVTVGGVQFSNGVVNTANAVTSVSIAAGGVQPQALQSGTGTSWAWASWTPTATNWSNGNGTLTAKYVQIGKTVFFRVHWTLGTTSAVTGLITLTLPVTASSDYFGVEGAYVGIAKYTDVGTSEYQLFPQFTSTTAIALVTGVASGTYLQGNVGTSAIIPGTWSNGDELHISGFYEAA